jgi:hypothetical protein
VASSTGRHFTDDALTLIASNIGTFLQLQDLDDDNFSRHTIYNAIRASMPSQPSLVSFDQCKKNATRMGASGFNDLLRKALPTKELSLWLPVVTHGASP